MSSFSEDVESLLVSLQSSTLPETLAKICNDIVVEDNLVCQAFTWDYVQQRGYFKGQSVNGQYNTDELKQNSTMCNSPSVTTWILNAGTTQSLHILRLGHDCACGTP